MSNITELLKRRGGFANFRKLSPAAGRCLFSFVSGESRHFCGLTLVSLISVSILKSMKSIVTALFVFATFFAGAQRVEKVWETDAVIATPESVLPVPEKNLLYISLIDGTPWGSDGKGGVGRMKMDGTGYDSTWITGLHAPKGMGLFKNRLYVADISEVIVIDVKKGKIEKRIPVEGASGLNDITISDKGVVYVSDSKTARVWQLKKDVPVLYLENMQGVNGLRAVGTDLWVASGKSFIKADAKKTVTRLAELSQGGDGIEPVGNGDFLVSSWGGYLFYVSASGKVTTLLETHGDKKNIADIGYDPVKRLIYIPTFFANTVSVYRLVP
jgi:hypothetical protein